MASTHTPGPWTFEPSDEGDASVGQAPTPPVVFVSIPNDDRFRSIEIAVVGTTIYGCYEDGEPKSWGDPDANARLIAAAPDLLTSLLEFVALYDGARDVIGDGVAEKLARAEAAIAKATGGVR